MGEDAGSRYRGHYRVKAMNLVRRLREAYDRALADYDLLLMPSSNRIVQSAPLQAVVIAAKPAAADHEGGTCAGRGGLCNEAADCAAKFVERRLRVRRRRLEGGKGAICERSCNQ
jgi:hypothetical protein